MSEKHIGWAIRQLRQSRDWKLEDLADMVGTDQANLSKFERGEQWISAELLKKLSDALETPIWRLFQMVESPVHRQEVLLNFSGKDLKDLANVYLSLPGEKRKQALRLLQALKE